MNLSLHKKRIKSALATTMIRLRDQQGINQAELALRSGLSRQYISMVERQERSPNVQTLMKLCIGLNVDEPSFFITMLGILKSLPVDSCVTYRDVASRPMLAAERPLGYPRKAR